jgi:hypothetical protein
MPAIPITDSLGLLIQIDAALASSGLSIAHESADFGVSTRTTRRMIRRLAKLGLRIDLWRERGTMHAICLYARGQRPLFSQNLHLRRRQPGRSWCVVRKPGT